MIFSQCDNSHMIMNTCEEKAGKGYSDKCGINHYYGSGLFVSLIIFLPSPSTAEQQLRLHTSLEYISSLCLNLSRLSCNFLLSHSDSLSHSTFLSSSVLSRPWRVGVLTQQPPSSDEEMLLFAPVRYVEEYVGIIPDKVSIYKRKQIAVGRRLVGCAERKKQKIKKRQNEGGMLANSLV